MLNLIDISRGSDIGWNTNKPIKSQVLPEHSWTQQFVEQNVTLFISQGLGKNVKKLLLLKDKFQI